METPELPKRISLTLEESVARLRDHDAFLVLTAELRSLRDDQFRALKGQTENTVFEIVGAVSMLDDLIALFEGVKNV